MNQIHDRECIGCQDLFKCPGKPEIVKDCIKLKERKKNEQQTIKDGKEANYTL